MDYIDRYKKALRNEFASDEDKKAQKEFIELARKDIGWARKNNLIRTMTFEDYMETHSKQRYTEITPEMRGVIMSELDIPAYIIAQYYDINPTTVSNIRSKERIKEKRRAEGQAV
mgnify:CR=1 FL=1